MKTKLFAGLDQPLFFLENISFSERKKTDLYQELGLQARDLRFQHLMSITTRNNRIILRMEVRVPPGAVSRGLK